MSKTQTNLPLLGREDPIYLDEQAQSFFDKDAHSPELVLIKKGLYPKT